jgi:hypothetical protein
MTHVFRRFFKISHNKKARKSSRCSKLELITLEDRITPATFIVTNTSDVGPGSLRQAIIDANTASTNDDILFSGVTGTITLNFALSTILPTSTAGTLTIIGPGSSSLNISGNNGSANRDFNIFTISKGGNLSISGVMVSGAITTDNGGAFDNAGALTVSNCTISGNSARGSNFGGSGGGGIFNAGTLTVSNSTLSGNSANGPGGGGGINNTVSATLTVSNSNISGNSSPGFGGGGGIYNRGGTVNISNSTISGNSATSTTGGAPGGGGIQNNGTLTLSNSTLSGNSTVFNGGGIHNGGNLTVSNSTISGNTAGLYGGGIFNPGGATISNSTISGNSATAATSGGGGIRNRGTLTLLNSTLSDNSAPGYGGGLSNLSGTLNIANIIIANSTGGSDLSGPGIVNLITGATATNNLITILALGSTAWATKVTSAALNLGPLQNNGGPTLTMALLPGSVAISTGSPTISNAPPINGLDQRGVNRSSTAPSIGAFEIGSFTAALNPTFGPTTSTADGFTVQITNYDAAFTFSGTATANGVVSISNAGLVTVTGVATGTSSTATIITTRFGYNPGSGIVTASSNPALPALNPTFGTPISTANGFTVQITNYDPAFAFSGTATANGTVAINGTGLVTVTGVALFGISSTATIITTRIGYNSGSGTVTGSSIPALPALNPTFGSTASTADGFTVQITNYDALFTFSGTATANGNVAINGTGLVTVTGVALFGISSTATITTTRFGYNPGSGTVTGSSTPALPALNPTFGPPTSTTNGFTVQITNYDPAFTYGGTATASGRVSINNTGIVTVIGVAPGTASTAFITVTRFGYNPGFGSITATSINGAAPNPTFGAANSTANGFTVQITNYDGINYFYGSSVSNGSVSINSGGLITVTSIAPRTSSTVNITTSRNGYNSGFGTFTGTSGNGVDLIPTFGTPSSTTNGFNVQITNYDSAFNFFGTATANGSVSISGTGLVVVTGVAPGTASTATITTTRTNYNSGTGTIAATSINGAALNSTFGTPSSTANGFTVQIANYNSASYTYSSFVFTGSATINGSGLVTVTGIAPSTSSTVFITTNRVGYNSGTGSIAATSSIGTALNPTFGTPSSTTNGFNVQITNFDAAFTYAGTATANGSVSINSTGLVAVTGVAIGTSSTATITTTRSGYNSGSSTVTASAGPNVQFAAGTDSGGGPVVIVKFTDGSSLSFFAYDPTYTGGVRVALGDLNGDGTNEVICGAGVGGGPNVRVFSVTPSRATMVANFFAFEPVFMGGVYVAAGNLDGNVSASGHGIDDLIVSAGPGGGPRVIAFSGGTNYVNLNSQLCDYFVYAPTFRGGVTVAAGNVFGGVGSPDEVITGAGAGGGPHVRAFQLSNTNTPNSVLEYMAFDPDFRNGIYVSSGDISGDGIDDIFTGSNAESNNPSMVNVHQSNGSNTLLYPFAQFAGGARVGVARDSSNNEYMVVGTGPGVDRSLVKIYNRNLIAIDSLFVFPIEYTGGVFVNTSISS